MAKKPKIEVADDQPSSDIMKVVESNPSLALLHESTRGALLEYIDKEIAAHVPDLLTQKGRDATASLAFKIVRTKTAIEKAAVALRAAIQAEKEGFSAKLVERATNVRKPLTDWEEEQERLRKLEEERKAKVTAEIEKIKGYYSTTALYYASSSEELADLRRALDAYQIDREIFKGEGEEAEAYTLKNRGLEFLADAIEKAEKAEEEAAELERLREANRKRQADEDAKRALADAQERNRLLAQEEPPAPVETSAINVPVTPGASIPYTVSGTGGVTSFGYEITAQTDVEIAEEELVPNSDFEVEPSPEYTIVEGKPFVDPDQAEWNAALEDEKLARVDRISEVARALEHVCRINATVAMIIATAISDSQIPHCAISFD